MDNPVIALAGIGLVAIVCQWAAWLTKFPAILWLLLAGILIGPGIGWLDPDALFGDLLFPFVSLAVAIVLFEGSLTLRFSEIQGMEHVVRRLISIGMLLTWLVTTLAAHWLVAFPWQLAFLFGALTVVTGPTVIVPILRTVRPTAQVANILRWEGVVIDPIGALLAVLVFEFIISGKDGGALGHTFFTFSATVLTGVIIGAVCGQTLGVVLRRHWLPVYLHNLAVLTVVIGAFALSNWIQEESGLLAVTIMGIWMANMKNVKISEILDFKESLSVLFVSGLFILLAARLDLGQLQILGTGAIGVLLVMQLIARPLKVFSATLGSSLNWRERLVLAWIGPRGVVAAAMAALFAIRLQQRGYEFAELLVPLTFFIIIGTVLLQSATARPLAKWLGVAEPEPRGFLILGANPLARAIAAGLKKENFRIVLADGNWDNIRIAMLDGHTTYYGNVVSEHADRHLDLIGIGRLLALSPQSEVNTLAALRYRAEFGTKNIYTQLTQRRSRFQQ